MDIYLSGAGMTHFGKSHDSLEELMVEAARLALKDARIRRGKDHGVHLNCRSPNVLTVGQWVSLKKKEGLYVFEKFTAWNRMGRWLKHLPRSFR